MFFTFFFNLHFWKIILLTIELLVDSCITLCVCEIVYRFELVISLLSVLCCLIKRFTIKNFLFSVSVGPSFNTFLLLLRFSVWACFSSLIVGCLCLILFVSILHGFYWACWIWKLSFLYKYWKFSAITSLSGAIINIFDYIILYHSSVFIHFSSNFCFFLIFY